MISLTTRCNVISNSSLARLSIRCASHCVKVVFIHGAPGTGKGTLCKHALHHSNAQLAHISVGDLLRNEMQKGIATPNWRAYEKDPAIDDVRILPSFITTGLLLDKLEELRQKSSLDEFIVLVDGFPRTLDNLELFCSAKPSYILFQTLVTLECTKETILSRLLSNQRERGDDKKAIILKRLDKWFDGSYQEVQSKFDADEDKKHFTMCTDNGTCKNWPELYNIIQEELKWNPQSRETVRAVNDWSMEQLNNGEMPSYVYSYPTKRAYVPLSNMEMKQDEIVSLAWKNHKGPLNIYFHIPYCQMNSFCNLFTTMNFYEAKADRYIEALKKEVRYVFKQIQQTNAANKNHV